MKEKIFSKILKVPFISQMRTARLKAIPNSKLLLSSKFSDEPMDFCLREFCFLAAIKAQGFNNRTNQKKWSFLQYKPSSEAYFFPQDVKDNILGDAYDKPYFYSMFLFLLCAILAVSLVNKSAAAEDENQNSLNKSLADAVSNGDLNKIKELIQLGANVKSLDSYGRSAFLIAAEHGYIEIMAYLLEHGSSLDEKIDFDCGDRLQFNFHGSNALMMSAFGGHVDAMKWLVKMGLSLQSTSAHGDSMVSLAAFGGHIKVLEWLEEHGLSLHNKDDAGYPPIRLAASGGHIRAIEFLLSKNADINAKDKNGRSSLHTAVYKGHKIMVEFLLSKNADINAKDNKDWSPLFIAAASGKKDIVELLLSKNADINAKDKDGLSPLHIAVASGQKDIVELLFSKNADINAKDKEGWSPLHIAAVSGEKDIVKLLLSKNAEINVKNKDGLSPLHIAAVSGEKDIVEFLLSENADINAKDNEDRSPLYTAAASGKKDIVEFLFSKTADINAKDKDGWSSLHIAVHKGHKEVVEFLLSKLSKTADINAKDKKEGWSPLHIAVVSGEKDIVELLLSNNADINAKDNKDRSPLYIAEDNGENDIVKFLLSRNADTNVKDKDDLSPLHIAAANGKKDTVELLLSKGAKIDAMDKDYWTPLHFAIFSGQDVVECLLRKNADIKIKDQYGFDALHLAAAIGERNIFNLIQQLRTDNAVDSLHYEIFLGKQESNFFVPENYEKLRQEDNCGWSALHWAVAGGKKNEELIKTLLKENIISLDGSSVSKNNVKTNPLRIAICSLSLSMVNLLLQNDASFGDNPSLYIELIQKIHKNLLRQKDVKKERLKEDSSHGNRKAQNAFVEFFMHSEKTHNKTGDMIIILEYIYKAMQEKLEELQEKNRSEKEALEQQLGEFHKKEEKDKESAKEAFRKVLNEQLNVSIYVDRAIYDGAIGPKETNFDKFLEVAQLGSTLSSDVQLRIAANLAKIFIKQEYEKHKQKNSNYIKKFSNVYIQVVTRQVSKMIAERYKDQLLEMTAEGMDSFAKYFHDRLLNYFHNISAVETLPSYCDSIALQPESYTAMFFNQYPLKWWCDSQTPQKTVPIVREMYDVMIAGGWPSIPIERRHKTKENIDPAANWDSRELVENVGILVRDKKDLEQEAENSQHTEIFYIKKPPTKESYGFSYGEPEDGIRDAYTCIGLLKCDCKYTEVRDPLKLLKRLSVTRKGWRFSFDIKECRHSGSDKKVIELIIDRQNLKDFNELNRFQAILQQVSSALAEENKEEKPLVKLENNDKFIIPCNTERFSNILLNTFREHWVKSLKNQTFEDVKTPRR